MKKYALAIGVSHYESGLNVFTQASRNAEEIDKILLDPEQGNFDPNNVMFAVDPDKQTIEKAIKTLFSERQAEDLVLLFFSGRIIQEEGDGLYLGATNSKINSRGNLVKSSAVAAKFLRKQINSCKSKHQVIILDSCFTSLRDDRDVSNIIDIKQHLLGGGRFFWNRGHCTIATAASSEKYAFARPGEELSPYTSYLVEGIRTAEADRNCDGWISIKELHQYAREKVQAIEPKVIPNIYYEREDNSIQLLKVHISEPEEKYAEKVLENMANGKITLEGREILDRLRGRFGLSLERAKEIETEVLGKLERELKQNLDRFERDFREALKQEISPSRADIKRLKENFHTILGLTDRDTYEIETKVRSELAKYKQHIREYEDKLYSAMRKERPLSPAVRDRLDRMKKLWKLSDRDVALAESRMNIKIETYNQKLLEYETELSKALQEGTNLSVYQHSDLIEKQKSLNILDEDVVKIKMRLRQEIESHNQGLANYKTAFIKSVENNYPLSEENRLELKKIQKNWQLSDEEVIKIESQILREKRLHQPLIQPKLNTDILTTTTSRSSASQIVPASKHNQINIINKAQRITKLTTINKPNFALIQDIVKIPNLPKFPTLPKFINFSNLGLKNLSNINLNRRKYLKWLFFVVIGLLLNALFKSFLSLLNRPKQETIDPQQNNNDRPRSQSKNPQPQTNSNNQKQTKSLQQKFFEIATIDATGRQINKTTTTAEYLTEDLSNGVQLEIVKIPQGKFIMGTPTTELHGKTSERPQHEVSLKPFFMSAYQVTQAQWRAIAATDKVDLDLNPNPSYFQGDNLPVERVSWDDAVEFCQRLSRETKQKYRLPSEAEWEYAARARTNTPFYFGETINTELANYNARFIYKIAPLRRIYRNKTTPVGSFFPNAFGLFDMHGNVWEWCYDTWHDNYLNAPTDGSPWISPRNRSRRVIRGGSWSSDALSCRSGAREPHHKGGYQTLGFRVVREI